MTADRPRDKPSLDDQGSLRQALGRRSSPWQALKAVAWSFFGVRRSSDYERDVNQLNPLHLVIAGLLAAAVFVAVLILLVQWVVA